jgi:hypothetical protein
MPQDDDAEHNDQLTVPADDPGNREVTLYSRSGEPNPNPVLVHRSARVRSARCKTLRNRRKRINQRARDKGELLPPKQHHESYKRVLHGGTLENRWTTRQEGDSIIFSSSKDADY